MDPFTTEAKVREIFALDLELPAEVVERCIGEAHEEVEKAISSRLDIWIKDPRLTEVETNLAGSKVYYALALTYLKHQNGLVFGHEDKPSIGLAFRNYQQQADIFEAQASSMLEDYISRIENVNVPGKGAQN